MFTAPIVATRPRRVMPDPIPTPTARPRTVMSDPSVASSMPYPSPTDSGQSVVNLEAMERQQQADRVRGSMEALARGINASSAAVEQSPVIAPLPDQTIHAPGPSQRNRIADPVNNALHNRMLKYDEHPAQGLWGHTKQALKTAAIGALQGMGSSPNDPIAGAIGGAAAGGIIGGVRPDIGEEYIFSRTEQPYIEGQIAKHRADAAYQNQQADQQLDRYGKAANIAYTQARTEDLPAQRAIDQQRWTQQQNQANAKLMLEEQAQKWQQQYQMGQLDVSQQNAETSQYRARLDERSLNRQEAESGYGPGARAAGTAGQRKLNPGDESALREQSGAYVTKAFSPDEMNSILAEYVDKAYRARVKPEDEARARTYDAEALDRVGKARTAAETEARNTLKREADRWQQLFHDELRARATRGLPPPQGGELTDAQVQAVAAEKKISVKDAYRFLQAFGYSFKQNAAPNIAVGHTQQPSQQ